MQNYTVDVFNPLGDAQPRRNNNQLQNIFNLIQFHKKKYPRELVVPNKCLYLDSISNNKEAINLAYNLAIYNSKH